ncbi:hypothetical protein D3C73_1130290 [compost metagenome]
MRGKDDQGSKEIKKRVKIKVHIIISVSHNWFALLWVNFLLQTGLLIYFVPRTGHRRLASVV